MAKPTARRKAAESEETYVKSNDVLHNQFPSVEGEVGVEVAKRGADNHESDTTTHRKVFTLQKAQYNPDEPGTLHEDNKRFVRQEAIGQGLRPTGDVSFDGAHDAEDDPRTSVHLVYSVGAVPAAVATVEDDGQVFVNEDEQHAYDEGNPSPRDADTDETNDEPTE